MRTLFDAARAAAEIARLDPTELNLASARTAIESAVAADPVAGGLTRIEKGLGYNPNRDERGRFSSGPSSGHAKSPTAVAVEQAQGKRAAAAAKLAAAKVGKKSSVAAARTALQSAKATAKAARLVPTKENIRAAKVAVSAATRAGRQVDKHTALVAKLTAAHSAARDAHIDAKQAHSEARAAANTERSASSGGEREAATGESHIAQDPDPPKGTAQSRQPVDGTRRASSAAAAEATARDAPKNPKRVEAARTAAAASVERRREIHSAVASNLPRELQATWAKEGHKFMQQESSRIRGEKDRINAASRLSEAFAEQYAAAGETGRGYEGDRYHRRAEIEANHAESWADEQERKYYAAAERHHRSAHVHDDEVPF